MTLCRLSGIALEVHFTFPMLLIWLGWVGYQDNGPAGAIINMLLIICIFVCVVLHELGHALTARRFGIVTERILLMPIGGMAQMARIPQHAKQELLITLAGPAVNILLAGLFYGLSLMLTGNVLLWVHYLLLINLAMALFNLLPAFPMDGGRILRALLAMRMPYLKATRIATLTGKCIAGAGVLVAALALHRPILTLLFAFIYLAANAEYRIAAHRMRMSDTHEQACQNTPLA